MRTPIVRLRLTDKLRAAAFGRYPSSAAACSIRRRLISLTFGEPDNANDTSDFDMPARAATSRIVGRVVDMVYRMSETRTAAPVSMDFSQAMAIRRLSSAESGGHGLAISPSANETNAWVSLRNESRKRSTNPL